MAFGINLPFSFTNSEYFLNAFPYIIDYFSRVYDDHLIMEDFNLEPNDPCMKIFLNSNSFINLINTRTCFKAAGSYLDLILTNGEYSFQYRRSYETGWTDHPHMIYTMLKTSFINTKTKLRKYHYYKNLITDFRVSWINMPYERRIEFWVNISRWHHYKK